MAIQQLAVNILSNEKDRTDLFKVIKECSDSMTRMEGEKDFIKEAIKDVSDKFEIPKRLVNRMVKVYHKQSFDEEVASHGQFETLYESVVK